MKPVYFVLAAMLAVPTTFVAQQTKTAATDALPTVYVYGPGGPLSAMKEAATTYSKQHHVNVVVVAGPTPKWLPDAKQNADLIYSGSEEMMSDLQDALETLDPKSIVPLYLRKAAILVRPGNPAHIHGVQDLLQSGHHILVVNGAGQKGLWEDIVGRQGEVLAVKQFRTNIANVASNSAEARTTWTTDSSLDVWLTWTIWQVSNPTLADIVPVDDPHQIYRDCGAGLTANGEQNPSAVGFLQFLQSSDGEKIFVKWGWSPRR